MTFEYTRVSTNDQNPERQHIAIAEYAAANGIVIDRAYEDKASGRDFQRPQYQAMKATLRAGDVVIVKDDCVNIELNSEGLENTGFCEVSSVF